MNSLYYLFKDGVVVKARMNSAGLLFEDAEEGMYLLCVESASNPNTWYTWSYDPENEDDGSDYVHWVNVKLNDVPPVNLLAAILIK